MIHDYIITNVYHNIIVKKYYSYDSITIKMYYSFDNIITILSIFFLWI